MPGRVFRTSAAAIAAQVRDQKALMQRVIIPAEWESAQRTMALVVKDSPVDQGAYKAGWEIRRTTGGHPHLHNDAPHAGIIELGARPHWPPFQPIYEWALRKAGDLHLGGLINISPKAFRTRNSVINYRGQSSLKQGDRDAVAKFAHAVQAKIAREGSRPRYVMRNRLDDARRFLQVALERRLAEFASRVGSGSRS